MKERDGNEQLNKICIEVFRKELTQQVQLLGGLFINNYLPLKDGFGVNRNKMQNRNVGRAQFRNKDKSRSTDLGKDSYTEPLPPYLYKETLSRSGLGIKINSMERDFE